MIIGTGLSESAVTVILGQPAYMLFMNSAIAAGSDAPIIADGGTVLDFLPVRATFHFIRDHFHRHGHSSVDMGTGHDLGIGESINSRRHIFGQPPTIIKFRNDYEFGFPTQVSSVRLWGKVVRTEP